MTSTRNHTYKSHHPSQRCLPGKTRLFNNHLFRENRISNGRLLAELDEENVQIVILDRYRDSILMRLLRNSPNWIVDFADAQSIILIRAH
jgi:hypothetical protein